MPPLVWCFRNGSHGLSESANGCRAHQKKVGFEVKVQTGKLTNAGDTFRRNPVAHPYSKSVLSTRLTRQPPNLTQREARCNSGDVGPGSDQHGHGSPRRPHGRRAPRRIHWPGAFSVCARACLPARLLLCLFELRRLFVATVTSQKCFFLQRESDVLVAKSQRCTFAVSCGHAQHALNTHNTRTHARTRSQGPTPLMGSDAF